MSDNVNAYYGYHPDIPDKRDLVFAPTRPAFTRLPPSVDLRDKFPLPPFDQGELGSCTANAVAGCIIFDQAKQGLPVKMPSRLFQYYNSRLIEGTTGEDAGATIRDAVKAYNRYGEAPEDDYPYDIENFAERPGDSIYAEAKAFKPLRYRRVRQRKSDIRSALASGYPVDFGFSVYSAFESDEVASTGVLNMPADGEDQVGGHSVLIVSYDDATQRFGCRNSWGIAWGQTGHFTIPYDYVLDPDLAEDFWIIEQVR